MFDWQNWLPGLNPELMWILKVFFIALAIALVSFISKRVLRKIAAKVRNTQNRWDDVLLKALARPLTWVIWLEGLNIAADII
jgi:MscS family membrane protein